MFYDNTGYVWIGVHFGSRGQGLKITTKYLKAIGANDDTISPPALIEANSDLGLGYLAGVELGGLYAYAGREWVVESVRKIIGGNVLLSVHTLHPFGVIMAGANEFDPYKD
ncbi:MAG: RtcB family protein [Paracoccaceae bacterium]